MARALILILLLVPVHLSASTQKDPLSNLTPVTLQLKWRHTFQFAGFYAAVNQGYYEAEGFDVRIQEAGPGLSAIDVVLDGRADFGVADSSIVLHRLRGAPLVVASTVFQSNPLVLLTLQSSGLKSALDLEGKRVMFRVGEDGAVLTAMFARIDLVDKIEHVPHSFDIQALLDGEVDAFSAYVSDQPFTLAEMGVEVNMIDPASYGVDFYGDLIFTTEKLLGDNPEMVNGFVRASLKGWRYAIEHPESVVELLKGEYGVSDSREKLTFEAAEITHLIRPNYIPLGTIHRERFNRIAEMYSEIGLVDSNTSLDGFFLEDHQRDTRLSPLVRNSIVAALLAVLGVLTGLYLFNRRLRVAVNEKTYSLEKMNNELHDSLRSLKDANDKLSVASREAEKANHAKDLFLANMSHEIRTPLNGIYGSLQVLLPRLLGSEEKRIASQALDASKHLQVILNDLLDISKIEAGKLNLEEVPYNITQILHSVVETHRDSAERKGLFFKLEDSSLDTVHLLGDPVRVRQVVENLLSNAIKFTEHGEVQVIASQANEKLMVRVIDTGEGLSEEACLRIFDRFEQADKSTTRKFGGTGLGLAIASSLSRMMGGELLVESEVGVGSTFTLILPIREASDALDVAAEPTELSSSYERYKVLVAEDNLLNQEVIQWMLEDTGIQIQIVDNGAEAVDAVSDFQPDIVLMDIQMPVMNGLEACEKILSLQPDLPIIALTANIMKDDVESYRRQGFRGFLGKPYEETELHKTLATYLH